MGDVLSILLDLGKWPNSFPVKGEGGLRLGWSLEALIGVGVGKTDWFADWGKGEGAQEDSSGYGVPTATTMQICEYFHYDCVVDYLSWAFSAT